MSRAVRETSLYIPRLHHLVRQRRQQNRLHCEDGYGCKLRSSSSHVPCLVSCERPCECARTMTSSNDLIFFLFHNLWRGTKATSTPERTHAVVVNVLEYECAFEGRTHYEHGWKLCSIFQTRSFRRMNGLGTWRRTCPFRSHALKRTHAIVVHVLMYEDAFEHRTYYENDSNSTRYFNHGINKVILVCP